MKDDIKSSSIPRKPLNSEFGLIESTLSDILTNEVEVEISFTEETINERLVNLGIDSIKFVVLMVAIEEKYEFQFDDEFIDNYASLTLRSLFNAIKEKTGPQ